MSNREGVLEAMIVSLLRIEGVDDVVVGECLRCGCDKCRVIAMMYAEVRPTIHSPPRGTMIN